MEVNEATFAEMAKASMLDIASVTADVMGRDLDAQDMDSNVDDADDEIVGDEGTAKNQAVVHLTGRWRTKTAMNWNLNSLQAAVRSPTQRKRSPQHAPTGALVVPSAKWQFWRYEHRDRLLRQGKTV
jgi:hypothetical protein